MDFLMAIIEWVFVKSIYGAIIGAAVTYGLVTILLYPLKTILSEKLRLGLPAVLAGLVVLGFFLVAPSYERVQFEKVTLSQIEENKAMRLIGTTNWGSLTEPFTLFTDCCVGFFDVATPDPITDGNFSDKPTAFRRIGVGFESEVRIRLHVVSCDERTLQWSAPDESGIFRIHDMAAELSEEDFALYCNTDWSGEMQALRDQMLSQK